jgi:hypothetical protein
LPSAPIKRVGVLPRSTTRVPIRVQCHSVPMSANVEAGISLGGSAGVGPGAGRGGVAHPASNAIPNAMTVAWNEASLRAECACGSDCLRDGRKIVIEV